MAELKIQTGDGVVVPGQDQAKKQKEAAEQKAERDSISLFDNDAKLIDAGPDYTYKKIRFRKKDEVNVYAAEQDERYALDPRLKKLVIIGVATFIVFFLACILPTEVFSRVPEKQAISVLLAETVQGFQNFLGFFTSLDSMYATYVFTIFVTLLAGAAMALSGGIFQGSLKNALASPSTLGITSGGSIGAILYTFFIYPNSQTVQFSGSSSELQALYDNMSPLELFLDQYGSFLCSLAGCAIVVTTIMLIAYMAGRGKVNNVALVVAGQVFTALIALIVNWIRMWFYYHGDTEAAGNLATMASASFSGSYTVASVSMFAIPLIACMAFCFAQSRRMSLLAFDEDEAKSMGISTTRTRNLVVAVCTIMTALVVSFCGMVGFVGFMVPHIARKLVGPDFRYLLPACALIGAILMCGVYYISNLGIPFIVSGGAGMITSVIGCISFLIIALRGRRSSGGEWL